MLVVTLCQLMGRWVWLRWVYLVLYGGGDGPVLMLWAASILHNNYIISSSSASLHFNVTILRPAGHHPQHLIAVDYGELAGY